MLAECPKCGGLMPTVSHCTQCGWTRKSRGGIRCPACARELDGLRCPNCNTVWTEEGLKQKPGDPEDAES